MNSITPIATIRRVSVGSTPVAQHALVVRVVTVRLPVVRSQDVRMEAEAVETVVIPALSVAAAMAAFRQGGVYEVDSRDFLNAAIEV
jgi:hypothetical protein